MKKILFLSVFILVFVALKAQVVNVCGTDTIILQVENYQNGVIEWQESLDTINWVKIEQASGTSYKFFPDEAKYYRAMVITSSCEPIYSEISYIQMPPVASAGTDRVVGDTITTLLANELESASGEWTIISGDGTFTDPTNPRSRFYGNFGETYTLVWTLTNACGTSSDTVSITFKEIQAIMNFIVVDNTDQIYSDSLEMVNGIYKIKFSDPDIAPYDSVILIGIREDISFLRKVHSFTIEDSVYTFYTEQASFADLISEGAINIGDAVNQSIINGKNLKNNDFPTRETIKKYADNKGLKVLSVKTFYNSDYTTSIDSGDDGLTINLPDVTIFKSPNNIYKASVEDSYVKLDPNFVFDYDYHFPFSIDIKFGADNAEYEYNYNIETKVTAPISFIDDNLSIIKVTHIIPFMAGPIPVLVTANFEIKGSVKANVNAAFEFDTEINYKKYFTALVMGDALGELSFISNSSETSTEEEKFLVQGGAEIKAKIGPEISFRAYDIVGPYLNLMLKAEAKMTMNTDFNWDAEAKAGVEGKLGAKAKIAGSTIFDFNYELFNGYFMPKIEFPYKVEIISGNFQSGSPGETLPNPITIKVTNTLGDGVFLVPVRFELESGNGTISETTLLTNVIGEVYVDWTLGNNPQNILKVSVLDSDNDDIENSPLFVYANTQSAPYNCTDSDLQINLQTNAGYIFPAVYGGTPPYSYSVDGDIYSSTVPQFDISIPGNYIVFVKDQNECVVSESFSIDPLDPCATSDLELLVYTQANIIELIGINGTSPYLYSMDDVNGFSSDYIYSNVSPGIHTFYVKDNNECIASAIVTVEEATQALIAISPQDEANYVSPENIYFEWIAGNYAPSQIYDIYLKKEGETYSLIAENLTNTSYTYETVLEYSTSYMWKITVKNNYGTELDNNEFSFNTASSAPVSPNSPVLVQPSNGATSVNIPVTLNWENQPGDFYYDLYLDNSDASSLYALNFIGNTYVVSSLDPNTKYYWKVVIKSMETGETEESEVWSFTTLGGSTSTVIDIDGNIYPTVVIGTQEWMAEDLRVIHYPNGDPIPNVTDNNAWGNLSDNNTDDAYCFYNNESNTDYGALYTYAAAIADDWQRDNSSTNGEGGQGVCPDGWHLPTDTEWTTLIDYLGGTNVAGGKMKETGTTHWFSPNTGADNSSGFTALPGGGRDCNSGTFTYLGSQGYWWSTTENGSFNSYSRWLYFFSAEIAYGDLIKSYGLSVRCLKD